MAVKKSTKKTDESAAPTKAEEKESAPKPKASKAKAAAPKAAEPADTKAAPAAPKKAAPAAAKGASPAAPKKAAAPIKLTPSQDELLKKIGSAAEPGYTSEKKVEERSIEALMLKKLVRKGAKDKATGKVPYTLSVAGKKHLG